MTVIPVVSTPMLRAQMDDELRRTVKEKKRRTCLSKWIGIIFWGKVKSQEKVEIILSFLKDWFWLKALSRDSE